MTGSPAVSTSAAEQLLTQYRQVAVGAQFNAPKAKDLLTKLKIEFTNFHVQPPFPANTSAIVKQLLIVRETLELAVQSAVQANDEDSLYRNFAQLKPTYYVDFRSLLPASNNEALVAGLHLMSLLTANRISDFHTEVEQLHAISSKQVVASPAVQFSLRIEQQLMEGSYAALLASLKGQSNSAQLPSPLFASFTGKLIATVRQKIGDCTEEAYDNQEIILADALKLFAFASESEFKSFAQQRNWQLTQDGKRFRLTSKTAEDQNTDSIANKVTIEQTMRYATELERIV